MDDILEVEIDWNAGAELTGASVMQVRFVKALVQGASKTAAARAAGYAGEGAGLRGLASRTAKSHKVMALLAWAKAGGAGPTDVPGDLAELKKILWRHARSTDAQRSIKATEVLHRLEAAEREATEPTYDPIETLDALAVRSPVLAGYLSVEHGLPWPKKVDRHNAMIELEKIKDLIFTNTANAAGVSADAPNVDRSEASGNGAAQPVT